MKRAGFVGLLGFLAWPAAVAAEQPVATSANQAPAMDSDCRPLSGEAGPRLLSIGGCVRSSLDAGDPVTDEYAHFEDYTLRLEAGETVRIEMDALPLPRRRRDEQAAEPFDTYVEVRGQGQSVPLAENDDRPGPPPSLNSTLLFSAPEAGDYSVRARALFEGTGPYTLRVIAAQGQVIRELRPGDPAQSSRIDLDDLRIGGRYYEEYNMRLAAGQVVQIDMESTEPREIGAVLFDPFLSIWAPDGMAPLEVADDRGGGSIDAGLIYVAPSEGIYLVRAEGLVGSTGNYRISAVTLPSVPLPDELGDGADGIWQDGSPATESAGQPIRYMDYRFDGAAGERIAIDATSNLLPTLRLARTDRAWFAEQVGEQVRESQRARLEAVLPETGTYIVRIQVPAPYRGRFAIRLRRSPAAPAPAPTP